MILICIWTTVTFSNCSVSWHWQKVYWGMAQQNEDEEVKEVGYFSFVYLDLHRYSMPCGRQPIQGSKSSSTGICGKCLIPRISSPYNFRLC